jgi:hypothetical protein
VSDWFFMLGEPLSDAERGQARDYLKGLGLSGEIPIEGVPTFERAHRLISHPDWDQRSWLAEQKERERLQTNAAAERGSSELRRLLSRTTEDALRAHGAAAVQAARLGCSDAGLTRAAAGAVGESLYLARLAQLAGETGSHPFLLKRALFEGGHWPLSLVAGRFYVF